jgi:hypothetical protein
LIRKTFIFIFFTFIILTAPAYDSSFARESGGASKKVEFNENLRDENEILRHAPFIVYCNKKENDAATFNAWLKTITIKLKKIRSEKHMLSEFYTITIIRFITYDRESEINRLEGCSNKYLKKINGIIDQLGFKRRESEIRTEKNINESDISKCIITLSMEAW